MKKLLIFLTSFYLSGNLFGQCDIAYQNASISPGNIKVGQTADMKFTIGNVGSGSCAYVKNAVKVVLSLPAKAYTFEAIASPALGKGTYFDWTYNASKRTLTGVNHTAIPVGAKEENVILRVMGSVPGSARANLNLQITDGSDNTDVGNDPTSFNLDVTATPLPVRLVSFKGKPAVNGNLLTWNVTNEQKFSHYEVEKGTNGKLFSKVGSVNGSGNSLEKLEYNYLDATTSRSTSVNASNQNLISYYRLRMVDLDGSSAYSKIIAIDADNLKINVGAVYPNPAIGSEVEVLIFSNENINWEISSTDLLGRELGKEKKTLSIGENKVKLGIAKNFLGELIFKFENADGSFTRKVIKQ